MQKKQQQKLAEKMNLNSWYKKCTFLQTVKHFNHVHGSI